MLVDMVIDGVDVPEDGTTRIDRIAVLLQRVAAGDQDAFARLYDLLSPRVFGLILRVLVDRAQSEEVLQEVFLEVWQSAARFTPNRGQGRSWVLTIAHRRAVDRVRASQASSDRDVRAGLRDLDVAHDGVAEQVELRLASEELASALSTLLMAQLLPQVSGEGSQRRTIRQSASGSGGQQSSAAMQEDARQAASDAARAYRDQRSE